MKLDIELSDEQLRSLVEKSLQAEFNYSAYSNGALAKIVMNMAHEQTKAQLAALDLTGIIQEAVAQYATGIVQDVVKMRLREIAKKVVGDMKDKGELCAKA